MRHSGGRGSEVQFVTAAGNCPRSSADRALWLDEVLGFLAQSNISAKNIERLRLLEKCEIDDVVQLAMFVRQVAEAKPHKKRRWQWLKEKQRHLFNRAVQLGLCEECGTLDF